MTSVGSMMEHLLGKRLVGRVSCTQRRRFWVVERCGGGVFSFESWKKIPKEE